MIFPFHDTNPTRRPAVVTWAVVAVNVVALVRLQGLPSAEQQALVFRRGFVPARIGQLFDRQPIVVEFRQEALDLFSRRVVVVDRPVALPAAPREILLSLLTCMFLHGGWFHLIGNMWYLLIFGNNVEDRLGHFGFALFYLFGGLAATSVHWAMDPTSRIPVIGASGAVAAVLGAYAITWPWARVRSLLFLMFFVTIIELPALLVLGVWFLAQILGAVSTLEVDMSGGVAWWAHVGGFLAGLILMPLVSDDEARGRGSASGQAERSPFEREWEL